MFCLGMYSSRMNALSCYYKLKSDGARLALFLSISLALARAARARAVSDGRRDTAQLCCARCALRLSTSANRDSRSRRSSVISLSQISYHIINEYRDSVLLYMRLYPLLKADLNGLKLKKKKK